MRRKKKSRIWKEKITILKRKETRLWKVVQKKRAFFTYPWLVFLCFELFEKCLVSSISIIVFHLSLWYNALEVAKCSKARTIVSASYNFIPNFWADVHLKYWWSIWVLEVSSWQFKYLTVSSSADHDTRIQM